MNIIHPAEDSLYRTCVTSERQLHFEKSSYSSPLHKATASSRQGSPGHTGIGAGQRWKRRNFYANSNIVFNTLPNLITAVMSILTMVL